MQHDKYATFYAFMVVQLGPSFFWDVVPCQWVTDACSSEIRWKSQNMTSITQWYSTTSQENKDLRRANNHTMMSIQNSKREKILKEYPHHPQ
jgi:hypothetical protein